MDELKNSKSELEAKISEIEAKDINQTVTEADVRSLLSNFSGYVISRVQKVDKRLCKRSYSV